MRIVANLWTFAVGAAALVSWGDARAQSVVSQPRSANVAEAGVYRGGEPSSDPMVAEGRKALAEIEQAASGIRQQLEHARAAHDVVKVIHLNDVMNRVDVALRSASDHVASLELASKAKDEGAAQHHLTVIRLLRDNVRSLVAEANATIGDETGFIGTSSTTVTVDPLPYPDFDDPYSSPPGVPTADSILINPPPPTSPIR